MTTGLDVFDTTVQETNLWLKDVMERIGTYDRHSAYSTLRAVLHAVRDRIGPENAAHLGAQLPMLTGTPQESRQRNVTRPSFWPISPRSGLAPRWAKSNEAPAPCLMCSPRGSTAAQP
jgi:hypothetical protein